MNMTNAQLLDRYTANNTAPVAFVMRDDIDAMKRFLNEFIHLAALSDIDVLLLKDRAEELAEILKHA